MSNKEPQSNPHIPDQRSYAFHQKAAEILIANPQRLEEIHTILKDWSQREGTQTQGWALKWLELIKGMDAHQVAEFIVTKSEQMDFYRKSSPFAGLLSEEERLQIIQKYKYNYE